MKVDRVLFCLNDNPTYVKFWNLNSKIWKNKFGVLPTLIYVGDQEEVEKNNLSTEFGEIIVLPKYHEDICKGASRQWYITWSLFYGATKFPNDACMTSGIDQIPLSSLFLDKIANIRDDRYVIGFADAYRRADLFPSSHHVAKGSLFKEKYEILDDWHQEVERVYSKRDTYKNHNIHNDYWGLDEAFSSEYVVKKADDVHFVNDFFHTIWRKRRIDRDFGLKYNIDLMKQGWYSELHSPRPYELYRHQVDQMILIAHDL
jgi:hypothetical protein